VTAVVSQEHCNVTGQFCGYELVCRLDLMTHSSVTSGWGLYKVMRMYKLASSDFMIFFKLFQV
jgi:hypothetical protein